MQEPILFSWSGGKDSAMALYKLACGGTFRIASLLTTVSEAYDRISMHGVRRVLLERQAAALGLPLHVIPVAQCCTNKEYEARMAAALTIFRKDAIHKVAFGDIFLEDLRIYRERNLKRMEMSGLFPIWRRDTRELATTFMKLGFRAIVVCVDSHKLDPSFAGRLFDAAFLSDLSATVDPCGENGEFHTFVFDGPPFHQPVPIVQGEVVTRDGFVFCDLVPA